MRRRTNRRIPILLGGSGEQRTLRLVAQVADIWNTFCEGKEFAPKSWELDEHCERIGRDPNEIERSVLIGGDPCLVGQPLRRMGASLFIVGLDPPYDLATVREWVAWCDAGA